MKRILTAAFAFAIAAGAYALTAADDPDNANCPLTGKAVNTAKKSAINKNVGFCCGNCQKKFKADPGKFLSKIIAFENKAINDACPLTGKAVTADKTATHNGDTVAFCCGNCLKKFKADPDKFAAKVKNANQAFNDKCPLTGKAINASKVTVYKKTVGFCCGNCKKKFDADPAKFAGKVK